MDIRRFIREHQPVWAELDRLLEAFESRKREVKAAQIDRLTQLYKTAAAHLAYAQTYYPADDIVAYLNGLVARGHHALYTEQWRASERIGDFFRRQFVGFLIARLPFIAIAFALMLLGGGAAYLAVMDNPLHIYSLLPAELVDSVDPSRLGEDHGTMENTLMSAAIMTNNIKVAIIAFVGGITFGALTVYSLVYNGVIVGALAAMYMQAGRSYAFWAYILPHGVIELTAIFIAGGAGLYMGYRMIAPGTYTRKYMLLRSIKESALLLIGTIPLFVIAGLIEGYLTPSALSLEVKYAVSAATLLALACYVAYGRFSGHNRQAAAPGAVALRNAAALDTELQGRFIAAPSEGATKRRAPSAPSSG